MSISSAIKLRAGFDEIRSAIAQAQTPFGRATKKEKAARKKQAVADLAFFAETYFPHYTTAPPSAMHKEFFKKFQNAIEKAETTGEGSKEADAAPRGNAKSTIATLILPLWAVVTQSRKFIALISDATEQAEEFLEFIKAELEINDRLREDFPDACGEGGRWQVGNIITANGVKLRSYGSGKRMRGARHGSRRPDLVICDDLENDENVQSSDQRKKMEDWFFKAVMKLGAKDTVYLVVGTILHYDSLLAKLLTRPGWIGTKFKAVINFSQSPRWQDWENIFADPGGEKAADEFFAKHKKEMLAGTEVLWPEAEDYYYLMKMRASDGPSAFDSEKQNEPINPDDCLFPEAWFAYQDEETFVRREGDQIFAACDPSMGKKSKRADPSAIIVAAQRASGYIDVLEADIAKRHPDAIAERLFEYHLQYGFDRLAVEVVQFQELFKDYLLKESARRGVYLPIEEVRPVTDKVLRISKLQPQIKNGIIRFRRNQTTLLEQLKYFPKAAHDDGPDGLEMVFSTIQGGARGPRIRQLFAA